MNINEQKTELLPIVIEGQTFKPNAEGLWSLNEIHQTLGLPESKRPSEWSNNISEELLASGNFRKVDKVGSFADELGTIAFAMWVSTAFYLTVARAFVTMRNDAILSARMSSLALAETDKLLADNIPKATALMLKAKGHGISWTDACRAAKIKNAGLAKEFFLSIGRFTKSKPGSMETLKTPRPIKHAFDLGYFKRDEGLFGNADGWRVTDKGVVWLEGRANAINEWALERGRKKSQARREAPKAPKVTV